MLTQLQIRDLAVIEEVTLDFGSGFTVLTGETGAGKSILIDALALAVGERGDAQAIRAGASRLEVLATFEPGRRQRRQPLAPGQRTGRRRRRLPAAPGDRHRRALEGLDQRPPGARADPARTGRNAGGHLRPAGLPVAAAPGRPAGDPGRPGRSRRPPRPGAGGATRPGWPAEAALAQLASGPARPGQPGGAAHVPGGRADGAPAPRRRIRRARARAHRPRPPPAHRRGAGPGPRPRLRRRGRALPRRPSAPPAGHWTTCCASTRNWRRRCACSPRPKPRSARRRTCCATGSRGWTRTRAGGRDRRPARGPAGQLPQAPLHAG